MRVKTVCSQCGSISILNSNNMKCEICDGDLIKVGFIKGHKLINLGKERDKYIEENIIHHKIDEKYIQMNIDYYAKLKDQKVSKEQERQQKQSEKITQYQNKYLSFVSEAENQGIPRKRAEDIATYAMQHNMYSLPHCPSCSSVDVSKISSGTKAAKTVAFGVVGALSDAGKTWKCNKCGSKW